MLNNDFLDSSRLSPHLSMPFSESNPNHIRNQSYAYDNKVNLENNSQSESSQPFTQIFFVDKPQVHDVDSYIDSGHRERGLNGEEKNSNEYNKNGINLFAESQSSSDQYAHCIDLSS